MVDTYYIVLYINIEMVANITRKLFNDIKIKLSKLHILSIFIYKIN